MKPSRAKQQARTGVANDEPVVDCSSLIDLCFLLLIYFLVTHTISAKEQDLNLELPNGSRMVSPMPPLHISINAEGVVSVGSGVAEEVLDERLGNQGARDLPLLCSRLAVFKQSADHLEQNPSVTLTVDSEAKHQHLIDVLNALAKYRIHSLGITDLEEAR